MITAGEAFSTLYPYLQRDALSDILGTDPTSKLNELACIDLLYDLVTAKELKHRNDIYQKLSEITNDELVELKFSFEKTYDTVFKDRATPASQPYLRHFAACALLLVLENRLHQLNLLQLPLYEEKSNTAHTILIAETIRIKKEIAISHEKYLLNLFSDDPLAQMPNMKNILVKINARNLSKIQHHLINAFILETIGIIFMYLMFTQSYSLSTDYHFALILFSLLPLMITTPILIHTGVLLINAIHELRDIKKMDFNIKNENTLFFAEKMKSITDRGLRSLNMTYPSIPAKPYPDLEIPSPHRLMVKN